MPLVERSMGSSGEEEKQYPPPLASHEELIRNFNVFWDTLRRFHFLMGTKFMIPVIGGKELDLHVLYVEVTKRSGYEKVVAEKKWREVSTAFNFSATTTSASFVLRKHYFNLLYHYEQVHFFKVQGPLLVLYIALFKELFNADMLLTVLYLDASFIIGEGTIEGKFDCGYLVNVKVGSEYFRGVLYHPDPSAPPTTTKWVHQYENAIVPLFNNNNKPGTSGRRRKNKRRWDPNCPKPNRSGYNFFFAKKHSELKKLHPNSEKREFTKMIGQAWNTLSSEDKMVYQNIGLIDKERYRRELKEYKEKIMLGETEVKRP
ncbi:hypothetical protein RIF29_12956 [Crotalaria pallida]|uniref:High mobility group B protein 9 n=1 Tax=Crotalaria pallida TaxID=3830 RepID=A0AAN9INR0_CROPI